MDELAAKNVIEAALLVAGRPLKLAELLELFTTKGVDVDKAAVRAAVEALGADYEGRAIELKEVANGYRVQVRRTTRDWLDPLFEDRAPRYTRALLETLALVAYRQPITRAEIEEVRGVAVSTNIVRTLMERGWIRVVGYRDVPGKPSMLGTTKEFLDYFGLKRLGDLPPLSEIQDMMADADRQSDFLDALSEAEAEQVLTGVATAPVAVDAEREADQVHGDETNLDSVADGNDADANIELETEPDSSVDSTNVVSINQSETG